MSIRDEINNRIAEGRLSHLPHSIPSQPAVRNVFVGDQIAPVINPPWANDLPGRRHAQFRAHLDTFTAGGRISVADDPYLKPKSTFIARVDPTPDEVWDMRVMGPKPGLRALGCFAEQDTFVCLVFDYHEYLDTDRQWRDIIERCKAEWRKLFITYPRFKGGTLRDYISRDFDPV